MWVLLDLLLRAHQPYTPHCDRFVALHEHLGELAVLAELFEVLFERENEGRVRMLLKIGNYQLD